MKKYLLAIFTLCWIQVFSQGHKAYFGIDLGTDFLQKTRPSHNWFISGNGQIAPGLLIGGQIGFVKFSKDKHLYVPAQFRVTIFMANNYKKWRLLMMIEPGWASYTRKTSTGTVNGGFVFFQGLGVKFPSKKEYRGVSLIAGFSSYRFKMEMQPQTHLNGVGLRLGFML